MVALKSCLLAALSIFHCARLEGPFGVLSGQDANELKEAMTYQSLKSFFYELLLSL